MNYCKHCGHQLNEQDRFCKGCGTPIQTVQQALTATEPKQPISKRIKQASKKQKVIGFSLIAIIIFSIVIYQISQHFMSVERLINRFETAITERDADALASMLTTNNQDLEIDADRIEPLFEYLEQYEMRASTLAENLRTKYNGELEGDLDDFFPFDIEEDSMFLFNHYQIVVEPFTIDVYANYADTAIQLNGETVATTDQEYQTVEIGPLLPGLYFLEAEFESEFAYLTDTRELELFTNNQDTPYIEFYLSADAVRFSVDYSSIAEEVQYYINDQEVELDDQYSYGPVSLDKVNSAYALLSFPWGEFQSNQSSVDTSILHLDVDAPLNEAAKKAIIEVGDRFGTEFIVAHVERDAEYFSVTDEWVLEEYLLDSIENMIESDVYWRASHSETLIDLDSFYVWYDEDEKAYYTNVDVKYHFQIAESDSEDDLAEQDQEDLEDTVQLELIYDQAQDQWLIHDYWSTFGFDSINTEQITHD
ncbi:zinc ribbon domain-containing protein [Amphibacillus jilinensis]|uniref:zinc ribbon domain-containing protein n=1 Tax=Amphibacillus jilinensis TaxID=1216008 RepID=UPI000315CBD2|nr:zinc ribbon domain-containing protein [Amphibacillus jilinensis]